MKMCGCSVLLCARSQSVSNRQTDGFAGAWWGEGVGMQKKWIIQSEHGWSFNAEWETWDVTEWVQHRLCKPVRTQQRRKWCGENHEYKHVPLASRWTWGMYPTAACGSNCYLSGPATYSYRCMLQSDRTFGASRCCQQSPSNLGDSKIYRHFLCFKGIVHSKLTPGSSVSSGFHWVEFFTSVKFWNGYVG